MKKIKFNFLNIMFIILAGIGIALLGLSVWFFFANVSHNLEDIGFRINLLTFLTGLLYLLFIYVIMKLIKTK